MTDNETYTEAFVTEFNGALLAVTVTYGTDSGEIEGVDVRNAGG